MQNSDQKEIQERYLYRATTFKPYADQMNEVNRQIKLANMEELKGDANLTTYSDEMRELLDIALKVKYGYEFGGCGDRKEAGDVL